MSILQAIGRPRRPNSAKLIRRAMFERETSRWRVYGGWRETLGQIGGESRPRPKAIGQRLGTGHTPSHRSNPCGPGRAIAGSSACRPDCLT